MSFVSVLDFGAKITVFLIAQRSDAGQWQILGAGDAVSAGMEKGEILNTGDAVESVTEAMRKAQKSAGVKSSRVYFNFDDVHMQSLRVQGLKILTGEGEVRQQDVKDVRESALRGVENFDVCTIYAKEMQFTIDRQDPVWDPLGVFGSQLGVSLHVLQARSELCQAWKTVIERCHVSESMLVPSAWSTAYGIFPPGERDSKKMVLDLGCDYLNFFIFEKSRITDCCTVLAGDQASGFEESASLALKSFFENKSEGLQIFATGDRADDSRYIDRLEGMLERPVQVAMPVGVSGTLNQPQFASVVGLLSVAEEIEKKSKKIIRPGGFMGHVKQKAVSLIHEYF